MDSRVWNVLVYFVLMCEDCHCDFFFSAWHEAWKVFRRKYSIENILEKATVLRIQCVCASEWNNIEMYDFKIFFDKIRRPTNNIIFLSVRTLKKSQFLHINSYITLYKFQQQIFTCSLTHVEANYTHKIYQFFPFSPFIPLYVKGFYECFLFSLSLPYMASVS